MFMEVTLKIDDGSKEAKALLAYLKKLPFVELKATRYNHKTEMAIKAAKDGIVHKSSLDQILKEIH